jgi:glutamate-1-semialdehyde 2,1-aminomutase
MTAGTASKSYMELAKSIFPGGVNSPVRSFRSVGGDPIVFQSGKGKWIRSIDEKEYIDFCGSWGPLLLGYGNAEVLEAVQNQLHKAMTFGAPCPAELALAQKMQSFLPGLELLRFVSSGTEATMSAIRVARAFTGRCKILKFEGCYHGHSDSLLHKAGSGLATLGQASSLGVPPGAIQDTISLPFNQIQACEELFSQMGSQMACVILEPMAGNMGLVLPEPGFLETLRALCTRHGAVLIFDEVMTGFRVARGGAQEIFGVQPDLWTFGKVIGGGLPAAAYGGKREIMSVVAPLGGAYQAGTLSGNPLAMVAGLATLEQIEKKNAYRSIEETGTLLDRLVNVTLAEELKTGKVFYIRKTSFFSFFFGTTTAPKNFEQVSQTNMVLFNRFYHNCLAQGVYLGPSGFEVGFLSLCHEESDLVRLVGVVRDTFKSAH